VDTGTVTISNVIVVDSATITATVAPADTDPDETAEVVLWGAQTVAMVVKGGDHGSVAPMVSSSNGAPPGMDPVAEAPAKITVPLPISETSSVSSNPIPSYKTGTWYKAELFGEKPEIKFDGRTTMEQDAGGGTSTCNTKGLINPEQINYFTHPTLSGGCWVVAGSSGSGCDGLYPGQTNIYGDDLIDIPKTWVTGIVARNPNGCTVTMNQDMLISCDTGYCKYWKNTLVLTIKPIPGDEHYGGTVSATRNGSSSQ
jgi:hypothetical protein